MLIYTLWYIIRHMNPRPQANATGHVDIKAWCEHGHQSVQLSMLAPSIDIANSRQLHRLNRSSVIQCCRCSRNIAQVKNMYFHYQKNTFVASKYQRINKYDFENILTGRITCAKKFA